MMKFTLRQYLILCMCVKFIISSCISLVSYCNCITLIFILVIQWLTEIKQTEKEIQNSPDIKLLIFFLSHDIITPLKQWSILLNLIRLIKLNEKHAHFCRWHGYGTDAHGDDYMLLNLLVPHGRSGPWINIKCCLTSIGNPIVEIRRPWDCLISTMGFPIPVRR